MATIEIQMPDSVMQNITSIVERAEMAVDSAQRSLEFTKNLVGETGPIYNTLFDELKAQRELLEDLRQRLHELGNAISGKLGAADAERFIRSVVDEVLKYHSLI